jgi:hypothetical protein
VQPGGRKRGGEQGARARERERERGRSFCAQMTGRQDKIYLRSGKTGLVQYSSGGYPFVS